MVTLRENAPAKVNLYLHITGRRPDGYHDLDSLAAFTTMADELILEPAETFTLEIKGPMAENLTSEAVENNLVYKAAVSLAERTGHTLALKLTLIKNLPVASGIGGGSSDAAAALRLLARYWGLSSADPRLLEVASRYGQDVPLCLTLENSYLTAEGTAKGPNLPSCFVLLINPNKGLATPEVYRVFRNGHHGFSAPAPFHETIDTLDTLVKTLKLRGNDLTQSAVFLMPDIKIILGALENTDGCLLARMSGSGATCFGIFENQEKATEARSKLLDLHPNWWIVTSSMPFKN